MDHDEQGSEHPSDAGDHDHGHGRGHGHEHGHGHANDRGVTAVLRYLRHGRRMWRSEINVAVVDMVAPRPGERVLDIGAGMGAGSMRVAAIGADVVAVEPTPFIRRILTMRRLFQRARARIMVEDGAAEHLPAADASIDALYAVNTMHHWVDVDRAVVEIARVLRPGGRIVLVDEDFDDPRHPDHGRFGDRLHGPDDNEPDRNDPDRHDANHGGHDPDGGAGHGGAGGEEHGGGTGGNRHGFTKVDAARMADALTAVGLVSVEAGDRLVIGRPVIAVTATASG